MLRDKDYKNGDSAGEVRRSVGRGLRDARQGMDLSLEDVERAIAVHARHLEALEKGDYAAFPAPLWSRGTLRTYANYLGLDGDRLADEVFPLPPPSRLRHFLRRRWRAVVAVLSTVALVVVVLVATVVAPYNPVSNAVSDVLEEVAPGTFLGSEPQRVMLLGAGSRSPAEGSSILVVRVAEDGLGLQSIPRDTRTVVEGYGQADIGEAMQIGGPDLARRSAAWLTGTDVQFYCVIDEEGIKRIVRSAGGIPVDVPQSVSGTKYLEGREVTLRPGMQTLDGDQALMYLAGSDLDDEATRARREQAFLYAMFRKALGPSNLISNPQALSTVAENVETNMSGLQMVLLAGRVRELKSSDTSLQMETITERKETPAQ